MISDAYTQSLARENARLTDGLAEIETLAAQLGKVVDDIEVDGGGMAAITAAGMASILLKRIQRVRALPPARTIDARPVVLDLTLNEVRS